MVLTGLLKRGGSRGMLFDFDMPDQIFRIKWFVRHAAGTNLEGHSKVCWNVEFWMCCFASGRSVMPKGTVTGISGGDSLHVSLRFLLRLLLRFVLCGSVLCCWLGGGND
jgi:hypothetical protein